jgi:short-subunit dehydrogenase
MTSNGKLRGERTLTTGSGTGLGREIALEFARQGADVVVHYSRSARGAHSAVEEIKSLGRRAALFQADLSRPAACFIQEQFFCAQGAGKHMLGEGSKGVIINSYLRQRKESRLLLVYT